MSEPEDEAARAEAAAEEPAHDGEDAGDADAAAGPNGDEGDGAGEATAPDRVDGEGPGLGKAQPHADGPEELAIASALESLVFASDRPLSAIQLGKLVGATPSVVKRLLAFAATRYEGRGIELVEVAGGYQFRTIAANAEVVRRLLRQKPVRLTRAQLETLAIIAYRQPVTRPEVDEIRGVDTGSALKVLLERHMLKVLGRKDEPGRPLLYGTTPQFLELFGLASLRDLPTLKEFSELSDESRGLFERRMGEPLTDDDEAGEGEADAAETPEADGDPDAAAADGDADDHDEHDEDADGEEDADDDDADDDDEDGDDEDGDDADEDDAEEERR